MSLKNLIFGVNSTTVSYFITKCDSYSLQNATEVYYKMHQVFYYKMQQFNYKLRQLLQNATFITNCDSTFFTIIVSLNLLFPYRIQS